MSFNSSSTSLGCSLSMGWPQLASWTTRALGGATLRPPLHDHVHALEQRQQRGPVERPLAVAAHPGIREPARLQTLRPHLSRKLARIARNGTSTAQAMEPSAGSHRRTTIRRWGLSSPRWLNPRPSLSRPGHQGSIPEQPHEPVRRRAAHAVDAGRIPAQAGEQSTSRSTLTGDEGLSPRSRANHENAVLIVSSSQGLSPRRRGNPFNSE